MLDKKTVKEIASICQNNKDQKTLSIPRKKKYDLDETVQMSRIVNKEMGKEMVIADMDKENYIFEEYQFANFNLFVYTEFMYFLTKTRPNLCYTGNFRGLKKNSIYIQINSPLILELLSLGEVVQLVERRFGGKFRLFEVSKEGEGYILFHMKESHKVHGPLVKMCESIIRDFDFFGPAEFKFMTNRKVDAEEVKRFLEKFYDMKVNCNVEGTTIQINLERNTRSD